MRENIWCAEARADLRAKVRSPRVRRELALISKSHLGEPDGDDGKWVGPNYWRRGITPAQRALLDADPAHLSEDGDEAWNYVLVYKRRAGGLGGFEVLGVYTNAEFGAAWFELVGLKIDSEQSGPQQESRVSPGS